MHASSQRRCPLLLARTWYHLACFHGCSALARAGAYTLRSRRYLTPVSAAGGNVFVGKLEASLPCDAPHAYVPALAAQGSTYSFSDGSGVAQRLLGNFTASPGEQEAAAIDSLQVITALLPHLCCHASQLVAGWNAVDASVARQVAAVYCSLIGGEGALETCLKLTRA